jgi:hypothetical protein
VGRTSLAAVQWRSFITSDISGSRWNVDRQNSVRVTGQGLQLRGQHHLLYLEESGVPLPAPGDVFVMYVGARVPRSLGSSVLARVGLIGVVVLGATT